MLAQWVGDLVGEMHIHKITKTELAQEVGVSREYISMVLNGRRTPVGIEQKLRDALSTLKEKHKEA